MASWVQPYEDTSRRVTIPHVTEAANNWQLDTAWVHFEGRTHPVAARGTRESDEWTVTTVWGQAERADAEAFLALLRAVALESDRRLDLRLEPDNGAVVQAVVHAVDVPQQIATARTDVTVTFRRVDTTT